jgi:hypothetical protein
MPFNKPHSSTEFFLTGATEVTIWSSDVPPPVTCKEEADMICLFNAIGLPPGGSSTVHIYTQTVHGEAQITNWEECGPCPDLYLGMSYN